MVKDTADPATLTTLVPHENCVPVSGELLFTKKHETANCKGSCMQHATLKDASQQDVPIGEMAPKYGYRGDGFFNGRIVTRCSELKPPLP